MLLVFSLIVGFTGSIISLLVSKPMAKWSTGAHVIETATTADEQWLVSTVRRFAEKAGIQATHVPYKGAEAVTDVMAGRVDYMFATLPSVIGQIKGGKLVPIGQIAPERVKALPNVPTMKELGYEGLENGSWFGLFAAKGTPKAIIDKMNAQVNAILKEPETQEALERQGATPVGGSPEDYKRFIAKDQAFWQPVVVKSGANAN